MDIRQSNAAIKQPPLIPDRSCGTCTLCCKVMGIIALQKQPNELCVHCTPGLGCGIYNDRPEDCSTFYCAWRQWPALGPHWFPADSHLVVILTAETRRLLVKCDPEFPEAWKAPQVYHDLKAMAQQMVPKGFQVAVQTGQDFVFILPDRDVDVGNVTDRDEIVFRGDKTPSGLRFEVYKKRRLPLA